MDDITINTMVNMSADLLDLTPDGWERSLYFDLSKLAEECGEVAACLNKTALTDEDLADELADVLAVCAVIALKKNINLTEAMRNKQEKRIQKLLNRFHGGSYPSAKVRRVL